MNTFPTVLSTSNRPILWRWPLCLSVAALPSAARRGREGCFVGGGRKWCLFQRGRRRSPRRGRRRSLGGGSPRRRRALQTVPKRKKSWSKEDSETCFAVQPSNSRLGKVRAFFCARRVCLFFSNSGWDWLVLLLNLSFPTKLHKFIHILIFFWMASSSILGSGEALGTSSDSMWSIWFGALSGIGPHKGRCQKKNRFFWNFVPNYG